MITKWLYVALGGALGSMSRYGLGMLGREVMLPWQTLLANVLGAFLIGFLAAMSDRSILSEDAALFLRIGFCGGFTTFSTFSLENMRLLEAGAYGMTILYMSLSFVLTFAAVFFGFYLGK